MGKALDTQVGGDHYKTAYQPLELTDKLLLNPYQKDIVKYITRYDKKDGVISFNKAIHYCQLALESNYPNMCLALRNIPEIREEIRLYGLANNFINDQYNVLFSACHGEYLTAIVWINSLKDQIYGNNSDTGATTETEAQ